MEGFTEHDRLELQAGQYAREAVPGEHNECLLTRKQVRALIRDAFKEGRLTTTSSQEG